MACPVGPKIWAEQKTGIARDNASFIAQIYHGTWGLLTPFWVSMTPVFAGLLSPVVAAFPELWITMLDGRAGAWAACSRIFARYPLSTTHPSAPNIKNPKTAKTAIKARGDSIPECFVNGFGEIQHQYSYLSVIRHGTLPSRAICMLGCPSDCLLRHAKRSKIALEDAGGLAATTFCRPDLP